MVPGPAGGVDTILTKADATQEKSLAAVKNMDALLTDTLELGKATVDKLNQNNEVIVHATVQVQEMEDDLLLAKRQIRTFTRRIMTDKVILTMIGLVVVGAVVTIVCLILKRTGHL